MNDDALALLLNKAKAKEKKYEWLQAAKLYNEAADSASKEKASFRAAELQEQKGFCLYKAAFLAQTNTEFKKLLKNSIQAYQKEAEILEDQEADNQLKVNHANALVYYTRSCLETNPSKKKELFHQWWTIEKQLLSAYEQKNDLYSVGGTCNDLIELSHDMFFLVTDYPEREKMFKEAICFAEKAIQIFSKLDEKYELAKAYCFGSWYYGFSSAFFDDQDKIIQLAKKCRDYSNKALELSQKIGEAWLISRSYHSAWAAASFFNTDPIYAAEIGQNMLKYAKITKDKFIIGFGDCLTSISISGRTYQSEDPDRQREEYKKAIKLAKEALHTFQIINQIVGSSMCYQFNSMALIGLAAIETDLETKQAILENAIRIAREAIDVLKNWEQFYGSPYFYLALNLQLLSATKTDTIEKRVLLQKAQSYAKRHLDFLKEKNPISFVGNAYFNLASVQNGLANIESNKVEKIKLLEKAVVSIEKGIEQIEKRQKIFQSAFTSGFYFGRFYNKLGQILQQIYSLTKEKKKLGKIIHVYEKTLLYNKEARLPSHVAESHWHIAQLKDELCEYKEASKNYESASEAYNIAAKNVPQLRDYYKDFSLYMQAWSQISQARCNHLIQDYDKAKEHFERTADLHMQTLHWNHLASNYSAWANMEEAESLSRKENSKLAKKTFEKAYKQFCSVEKSFKQKIEEINSADEKEMTQKLFQASNLRRKYCLARILLEDAKLLDREGKYLQSSKSYAEAAKNISAIIEKVDVEAERKELKYLAILCQAWEKMAVAEETSSSDSYLEAAVFFERARDQCFTRKASLWAMGNSSFCKGLAAGTRYQDSMDLRENAMAKRQMNRAAAMYQQAGFKSASEYAKATQRLFDAYVFMNQAESEVDPEKRVKQYQMAEKLLQISAGSFMKAKQPEKTAQVQQILKNVREEKKLAISLNEVLHAPTITSSTLSFTAPIPTNEASVGLESFEHANVQASLIAAVKEVKVGESFCLTVEFVNAGKEPALLMRVEDFVPPDFIVMKKPEIYRFEDSCLNMKGKQIAPLKLVEAKLVLQPSKKGTYQLKPTVHYLDELGQNKTLELKSVEIKVEEVILFNRIPTGTKEMDALLLGGIPERYAVVLTGSPSDEREIFIRNFLETGVEEGQTSFCVTTEATGLQHILDKPSFYLFLCNPKPKVEVPDSPNITKLRSKTDLNNLNMALARASHNLEQEQPSTAKKRVCIEIVSDVLLRHGPEVTRRWLSELITDLSSKGFTILAIMNPAMHPSDQAAAVLDLFDGEINLTQAEDPLECRKSIIVKKLRNQDFIKNPICLTKQK